MHVARSLVLVLGVIAMAACSGDDDEQVDAAALGDACDDYCDAAGECDGVTSSDVEECYASCAELEELYDGTGCSDEGILNYECVAENDVCGSDASAGCDDETDEVNACAERFCDDNPSDERCE